MRRDPHQQVARLRQSNQRKTAVHSFMLHSMTVQVGEING